MIGVSGIRVHINPTPEPSQGPSMGGACASTPTGGILHRPDLKSGIETCQMEQRAVLVEFDGFEFNGGCFGCARVGK